MKEECPNCGGFSDVALPPRYSPLDRFQRFRLKMEED
ncbi:MAG: RNA-protein complex protein Nop10 [Candidatus Thermoplasmatota archaeon]|jgi:rRNA maturation protein Nop10|nr:RNA-protein complex protein Nop10 [Candidatus Thermoplasmatota archaeon]MCL5955637.1 RNA-protein complex protein Nop10 [Candidatus Thermoplasmatota archaeon]